MGVFPVTSELPKKSLVQFVKNSRGFNLPFYTASLDYDQNALNQVASPAEPTFPSTEIVLSKILGPYYAQNTNFCVDLISSEMPISYQAPSSVRNVMNSECLQHLQSTKRASEDPLLRWGIAVFEAK
jgi:hypothetical protein